VLFVLRSPLSVRKERALFVPGKRGIWRRMEKGNGVIEKVEAGFSIRLESNCDAV